MTKEHALSEQMSTIYHIISVLVHYILLIFDMKETYTCNKTCTLSHLVHSSSWPFSLQAHVHNMNTFHVQTECSGSDEFRTHLALAFLRRLRGRTGGCARRWSTCWRRGRPVTRHTGWRTPPATPPPRT